MLSPQASGAQSPVRKLGYINVIPAYKSEKLPEGRQRKPKDCPEFEDVATTIKRLNSSLAQKPLPGGWS